MAQYTDDQWRRILSGTGLSQPQPTMPSFNVAAPSLGSLPISGGGMSAPVMTSPQISTPASTWDRIKAPVISGIVGLGIGALAGGGGGSSMPTLTPPTPGEFAPKEDYDLMLKRSLRTVDYAQQKATERMTEQMAQQMQQRGVRGSGIHLKGLSEATAEIAAASQAQRDKIALDIHNSMMQWVNAEAERRHEFEMARMQYEEAQRAQKRANKWGALSQIGGVLAQMILL